MSSYDSIIIGGGHNGLVCAAYLAKNGQRVLVLEANNEVGGLAATREFFPGFRCSVAHSLYGLSRTVVRELCLEEHGFTVPWEADPTIALGDDGKAVIFRDGNVEGVDASDTAAYADYQRQLRRFAGALAPFWQKTMPGIGDNSTSDLLTFAHMGLKLRLLGRDDMLEFLRIASLPMRDLVEEYFHNETLKAALCWDGLLGSKLAPRSPNQAVLTLLNRMAGVHHGQHSVPEGGIERLISALRASAENRGAEIRTGSPVAQLLVDADERGQRCVGVTLDNGETLRASRVISSADPRTTFFKLLGAAQLEVEFTNRIRRLRCDGYVAKLHVALDSLPTFSAMDDLRGRVLIAPTMDTIEFAYDDAKYGEVSKDPVLELRIPTLRQPDLAPAGKHVLSAQILYVPGKRRGGWDTAARDALTTRLLSLLEQHAPGISSQVLGTELLTPSDMAAQFHVTGGHWHHAEPAVDQLLMMRPTYEAARYRTPIEGLFLCGAGSHPGGDLTGNPGRNAAREILR